MTLELHGVSAPPLVGVSLHLSGGSWVVLGGPDDGTAALVALVTGMLAPRIGRVLVGGADPRRSPATRRRIGSLLEAEELLPGRLARDAVRAALELHDSPTPVEPALAALGLERWAERRVWELGARERRALALAVALAVPSPLLLALHEPLAMTAGIDRRRVISMLSTLSEAGSPVICTTASSRDALELGGKILVLHRGRIVRELTDATLGELVPGSVAELVVRTSGPRELAAALVDDPSVVAVHWSERDAPGQLVVRGAELDALALVVTRAARARGIRVDAIAQSLPTVHEVRAAAAGLARAAYDEAYRAAAERARAAAPPAPAPNVPPPAAAGDPGSDS
jgi:ABC-type multidrug transport system ATPase subunit